MKIKISLIGLLLLLTPNLAFAAIAFDNAQAINLGTGSTVSTLYTMGSAANGVLLVLFYDNLNGTTHVTGCTYNGVAMTNRGTVNTSGGGPLNVTGFTLNGPATGANTLQCTTTASNNYYAAVSSYTGATIDSAVMAADTGTKLSSDVMTVTSSVSGDSLVALGGGTPVGSTNTSSVRATGFSFLGAGDSNGSLGGAGSYNLTWTPANGSDWFYGGMGVALKPFAVAPSSPPLINQILNLWGWW